MVLEMDGGAEALASKLTSKVEGEALAVLSNTAALYGDILGYAVSQYGSSLAGEAASIVSEVQSGLYTLSQPENDLTEADAVLVQAMTSLVYSSLDLLSEMQSLPEGSSIADAQGLQSIISQAGLLVSYSEAVKDTARSTLPGTLSGLYDRLVSIVEGQGGAV